MRYRIIQIGFHVLVPLLLFAAGVTAIEVNKQTLSQDKAEATSLEPKTNVTSGLKKTDSTTLQLPRVSPEAGEEVNWWVISGGGLSAAGGGYVAAGTVGQPMVGDASNGTYGASHGYWQLFGDGCCIGIRGNANGDEGENINISDVTYLVDYLFGIPELGPAPPCPEEGNANGDTGEQTNISDITYLVEYLFGVPELGPAPPACP